MPEYLTKTSRVGKVGISSKALLSVARLTAEEDSRLTVNEKGSSCRFYGNHVKLKLSVNILDKDLDQLTVCKEVEESIFQAISDQMGFKDMEIHVYNGK
ncbi:MAG TPA: hypothetical protein DCY93_00335 [Firmicutes bacterium]|nr:hypothetical protein [Bacillota bacterium]